MWQVQNEICIGHSTTQVPFTRIELYVTKYTFDGNSKSKVPRRTWSLENPSFKDRACMWCLRHLCHKILWLTRHLLHCGQNAVNLVCYFLLFCYEIQKRWSVFWWIRADLEHVSVKMRSFSPPQKSRSLIWRSTVHQYPEGILDEYLWCSKEKK